MNDEVYHLLIYKKLKEGTLSPSETTRLDEWLARSPENRKAATEIETIWNHTVPASISDADIRHDLAALKNRIHESPVLSGSRRMRFSGLWVILAVLLAVAGGIFYLIRPNKTKNELKVFASRDSINRELQLPDGSRVWLNKNTELRYPSAFESQERRVMLSGEAFFEVENDASSPFIVEGGGLETFVLGTSFNVRVLPDEQLSEVTLVTGSISVKTKSTERKMQPGQTVRYHRTREKLEQVQTTHKVATAWHTGELMFQEMPLKDVFQALTRLYDVRFIIENNTLDACSYSAFFPNADLNKVLSNISTAFGCQVEKTPDGYRISGGNCDK